MDRQLMIDILMEDYKTRKEAEICIDNCTTIFEADDFEKNFYTYMKEWDFEPEEIADLEEMIKTGKYKNQWWSVIIHDNKKYYVEYCI